MTDVILTNQIFEMLDDQNVNYINKYGNLGILRYMEEIFTFAGP